MKRTALAFFAHGKIEPALRHIARAAALAPANNDLAITHGLFLEADRQTNRAVEILERLLVSGDESPRLGILYARVASALNRETDALGFIARVLGNGQPIALRDAASLHFCAAALLDRLARYEEAFERATMANNLRGVTYDARLTERLVQDWTVYFNPPTLRRLPHATHGSELPVFIVGMPRSGSTLVEQILCSHPLVHGGGEFDRLVQIYESLLRRYPSSTLTMSETFDRLSIRDVDALAEEYLQSLQAMNPHAARVTNKTPANFLHLGMVKLLFPQARVIYCRRDAQDTCLSCYMTDFEVVDFSTSLPSLGHYYRQHDLMMQHWKRTLNLSILDVQYEQVVDDLEGQTRRMLQFLDLPWDERCLRFHENTRFVATASNQQVRRPIYRTSIGRWRHYDRQLEPLRAAMKSNDIIQSRRA